MRAGERWRSTLSDYSGVRVWRLWTGLYQVVLGACSGARALPQYRVGWRTPDGATQQISGVARIAGPGHIDYDTLAEVVLATVSEQPVARSSARQSSPVVSL